MGLYELGQLWRRELDIHICHWSKHWTATGVKVRRVPPIRRTWCRQCRKGPSHSFAYIWKSRCWKFKYFFLKKAIVILFQFSTKWCISCFENNAVLTPELDIPHTINACARQPFSHCSDTDIWFMGNSVWNVFHLFCRSRCVDCAKMWFIMIYLLL